MTQREVAPELKQRFSDWIDARTQTGIQRYGEPLLTNNGRDARQDAFEELLDFTQYQQQRIMELEEQNAARQELILRLTARGAYLYKALVELNGENWEMCL